MCVGGGGFMEVRPSWDCEAVVGSVEDLGFAAAVRQGLHRSDEWCVVRCWLRSVLRAEGHVQRSGDGRDTQVR